jgi:GNAT superfamily N-acetyltransferase
VQPSDKTAMTAGLAAVASVTEAQLAIRPDEPRVEYGDEVRVPVEAGWADLAVVEDGEGEPTGYALCYLRRPGGGPAGALDVRLLGVVPGRRGQAALDRLVAAGDERARREGFTGVTVDVNLRHSVAAGLLRERGFQPVYELLRMERPLPGFDPLSRTTAIDCARWAG